MNANKLKIGDVVFYHAVNDINDIYECQVTGKGKSSFGTFSIIHEDIIPIKELNERYSITKQDAVKAMNKRMSLYKKAAKELLELEKKFIDKVNKYNEEAPYDYHYVSQEVADYQKSMNKSIKNDRATINAIGINIDALGLLRIGNYYEDDRTSFINFATS